MHSGSRFLCVQILFLLVASWMAQAETEEVVPSQPLQWQFSLSVGHGKYGTLLFDEQASNLRVLPRWSLYYQRVYLENLDVGFNLLETKHFSVDLSGKQNFDALSVRYKYFQDALIKSIAFHEVQVPISWNSELKDVLNLQQRHLSYLAGVSSYFRTEHSELRSEWHTDISGVHNGHEWNTLFRYQYHLQGLDIAPTFGIRRLDQNFANYYFGLAHSETSDLLLNQPGQMWLPSVKLDLSYQVQDHLRLIVSLKREWYPARVTESWFIGARQHDIWFMGLMYRW